MAFPTLRLTSKHTRSPYVKEAQSLLNGGNRHKKDWYKGTVDGEFGELTGAATYRAKWFLGYAEKQCNNSFGPTLHSYLVARSHRDFKPLPYLNVQRAKKRAKDAARKAKQVPLRMKALKLAKTQIGMKEHPANSNIVYYTEWYGVRGAWCAMFCSWAYVTAGDKKTFKKGDYEAYVPTIVSDARNSRRGLYVPHTPKPGDLVCFNWDGGVADHIGLFEEWVEPGVSFHSIEGNTSVGNDSNGGEVMRRLRYVSNVETFARVRE